MDINLLTVNVGNSRLAIGTFDAGTLRHVAYLDHAERQQWPQLIRTAWDFIAKTERPAIAAASVNPAVAEALQPIILEQTGYKPLWAGKDLELPISVLTDTPGETGVDRVLSVAAAYEHLGKACVVVDAGTAITVNLCNDNGDFVGGAIAPGASMMLTALHEKTAKLPSVKLEPPHGAFGTSTRQAMLHGVYQSIRGLVREVVENYASELTTWPEVIATGGDARVLFDGWELIHAVSPDLILYGIALAYADHQIRAES